MIGIRCRLFVSMDGDLLKVGFDILVDLKPLLHQAKRKCAEAPSEVL